MTDFHMFHVTVAPGAPTAGKPEEVVRTMEAVLRGYGYDIVPCNWTPDRDTVMDLGLHADFDSDTLTVHDLNPTTDSAATG